MTLSTLLLEHERCHTCACFRFRNGRGFYSHGLHESDSEIKTNRHGVATSKRGSNAGDTHMCLFQNSQWRRALQSWLTWACLAVAVKLSSRRRWWPSSDPKSDPRLTPLHHRFARKPRRISGFVTRVTIWLRFVTRFWVPSHRFSKGSLVKFEDL